jgi:glycosyltransferase involved in cell wall biosynthesis
MSSLIDNIAVTVITIVKDDTHGLALTIESLMAQKYIEWYSIIVVAPESDTTLELARKYATSDARISVLLQETSGIYPAMNEALASCSSDWIWFMNSGDKFFDELVLTKAVNIAATKDTNLVIGGYCYQVGNNFKSFSHKSGYFGARRFSLNRRWGCHQSMLINIGNENLKFDCNYLYAADFKFTLELLRNFRGYRTHEVFSEIEPGGVSSINIGNVLSEKRAIRRDYFSGDLLQKILGLVWEFGVRSKMKLRQYGRGDN